jgi:hypothetical protein
VNASCWFGCTGAEELFQRRAYFPPRIGSQRKVVFPVCLGTASRIVGFYTPTPVKVLLSATLPMRAPVDPR